MRGNTTKPAKHGEDNKEEMDTNEENDSDSEYEFEALNSQIDQLNSVLDVLEKKNDDIKAQLVELLKSNREARAEQEFNEGKPSPSAS